VGPIVATLPADKQQHLDFLIGKNNSGDLNSVKFAYQIKNSLRISLGGDESYSSGVNAFICGGADTICEDNAFMQYNRFPHITPYNERDTSIKQIKFVQPGEGSYYHQSLLANDGGPTAVNHFTQLQFRVATNQKQAKGYPEFQYEIGLGEDSRVTWPLLSAGVRLDEDAVRRTADVRDYSETIRDLIRNREKRQE